MFDAFPVQTEAGAAVTAAAEVAFGEGEAAPSAPVEELGPPTTTGVGPIVGESVGVGLGVSLGAGVSVGTGETKT